MDKVRANRKENSKVLEKLLGTKLKVSRFRKEGYSKEEDCH
jgi:hypothetical protein